VDKIVDNLVEEMGMKIKMKRLDTAHWLIDSQSPQLAEHPAVQEAAACLRRGETVAFPTETVYGLGANAYHSDAVRKIFAAKGRPSDNPLIVHIWHPESLEELVTVVPEAARLLMETFWPGPLTLILPSSGRVAPEVTGGLETVAVRMPSHPVAQALLKACGFPLAAPSANRSGRPSPTTAGHVLEDLKGRIAGVLDGGPVPIGTESTVVDVSKGRPVILRPGSITREELERVLGTAIPAAGLEEKQGSAPGREDSLVPRAPGMKYTHYAPKGQLWLVKGSLAEVRRRIVEEARARGCSGLRVGILTTEEGEAYYRQALAGLPVLVLPCGRRSRLETVARFLYACLRQFDAADIQVIYAESFASEGIGAAIMNRLEKASGGRFISAQGSYQSKA
jgi:L-threonylcarbamoyladenylate synthase